MNSILNRGFVSPYVDFIFDVDGAKHLFSTAPGNQSPKYFMSISNNRSVRQACCFELQIIYVPGTYGEQDANLIHQVLLTSVNKQVAYRYGYTTPGGGVTTQGSTVTENPAESINMGTHYRGIFTSYTESVNGGYLTYNIKGVASQIDFLSKEIQIQDYLRYLKNRSNNGNVRVGSIVYNLVSYDNIVDNMGYTRNCAELFKHYDISDIDVFDTPIPISSVNVPDGTAHDVFCGTSNTDGSNNVNGLVSLSYKSYSPQSLLLNGMITQNQYDDYYEYQRYSIANAHASSTLPEWYHEQNLANELIYKQINEMSRVPYVCYFDNLCIGSSTNGLATYGSFHYVPKYGRQSDNAFFYNCGNSYIDSDVLSLSISYDCTTAMASVAATGKITVDIDAEGNIIGGNKTTTQIADFHKPTYGTLSGFKEEAFLSTAMLANALTFPYEVTMTVVGQVTQTVQLMDRITLNVMVNGAKSAVSGTYVVLDISDNLSESGFTTTFRLTRQAKEAVAVLPYIGNSTESAGYKTQDKLTNGITQQS